MDDNLHQEPGGDGGVSDPVTFLASFPPIQSAIKIGSDGMRIQLDVPETEVPNAVDLLAMRGKVLRVTVEVESESGENNQTRLR